MENFSEGTYSVSSRSLPIKYKIRKNPSPIHGAEDII